ncbi:MAG: aminoacyl-tRNA hydrolase [Mariprofundales bacterium]|nr:aminoacyl-tRNA hydrolase [Mariprofundales bacterium]
MSTKMLVGLGNPGARYQDSRHNVGFRFLDYLARDQGLRFATEAAFKVALSRWHPAPDLDILLAKPLCFMNNSGESIGQLARYYRIDTADMVVVYDDLDMEPGKLRIKPAGGGHGGHNGLKSLNVHVGNTYSRMKLGIGRPSHGDITRWVLSAMTSQEMADEERIFSCLLPEMQALLQGELAQVSNRVHLKLAEEMTGGDA